MKLHIYSDLNLRYLDFANVDDEEIPECDAIIVAGNISTDNKRSQLFQETISKKFNVPLFINFGLLEFSKLSFYYDTIKPVRMRYAMLPDIKCYYDNNKSVVHDELRLNVLSITGFPYFHSVEDFKKSSIRRTLIERVPGVYRNELGQIIGYYKHDWDMEDFNAIFSKNLKSIIDWLANLPPGYKNILNVSDNAETILEGLDLTNVIVVTTGSEAQDRPFQNGRLISNPGSGQTCRSRTFDI
jgi:hypothetical protein